MGVALGKWMYEYMDCPCIKSRVGSCWQISLVFPYSPHPTAGTPPPECGSIGKQELTNFKSTEGRGDQAVQMGGKGYCEHDAQSIYIKPFSATTFWAGTILNGPQRSTRYYKLALNNLIQQKITY